MIKIAILLFFVLFSQNAFSAITSEECISYLGKKDKDGAFDCANKLVISSKDKKQAYITQGLIFSYFAEKARAVESYSKAISYSSVNSGYLYSLRANELLKLERYKESLSDFAKAIQFNEIQDDIYAGSLYLQRASIYQKINSQTQAINDYKKGKSILDKVLQSNWDIKNSIIQKPDIAAKASVKMPTLKDLLYIDINFGICSSYIYLDKLKDALEYCEEVHALDSNSVINKMNLSACYIDVGRLDDAKTILDSAPNHIKRGNFYINLNYASLYANRYLISKSIEDRDLLNEHLQKAKSMIRGDVERSLYIKVQKELEERAKK